MAIQFTEAKVSNQVWAPDDGDEVVLKDGRTGIVGDIDSFVWQGGNEWQVSLTVPPPESNNNKIDDEEELAEIEIIYDQAARGWKEI